MNRITLSNGVEVPALGLGANGIWGEENAHSDLAKKQYEIYRYAMTSGMCQLFDTSGAYGYNEKILGAALKDFGKREDIVLMSKVSNGAQRKGTVREAFERSLKNLNTDYLDLYLIHWPQTGTFIETWLQMEQLYKEGLVKAIGVCNFNIHHIEELLQKATIVPMVNQFERHPLFTQDALVNYCNYRDMKVIAYSPVARMHDVLIKSKPIFELARQYNRTPVQIILRWHYQWNHIAIPRTCNPEHLEEFFKITEFALTDKEMFWINSLNQNIRLRYDPDYCDFSRL